MEINPPKETVGIVPKSNRKITERGKIDSPSTRIHDRSLSYLGPDTSIKSDGIKLDLGLKSPLLVT
jgi:hypothetical protein